MKHLISLQALLALSACAFLPLHAASLADLTYTTTAGKVTITDCDTAATGELIIPANIEGKLVTSIGYGAFSSCDDLTTITISNGVTSIGNSAFDNCTSLKSITIGNGVTSIGVQAFRECTSLKSITIPDSVKSIGGGAFGKCTNLTSITITDGVTSIGDYAFYDCSSLTSIKIPDSVTSIGNYALFACSKLTSITISDSVTSIGGQAFGSCKSLTSITIGDGVTKIGEKAFIYCRSLMSITIPESVTSIGSGAFADCDSLTTIEVSAGNVNYTEVNGVLFNMEMTLLHTYLGGKAGANYVIPNSVTSIGESAFGSCSSLMSITIPDSVTSIGDDAFQYCSSLTNITIPDSVTSIGKSAFFRCRGLIAVTFLGDAPKISNDAFEKSSPTIYRKADAKGWGDTLAGRPVSEKSDDFENFDNAKVEKVIRDFVTAESPAELKKYIRDFERVGPLLDRYYERVDYEAEGFEALDMSQMKYNGDVVTMLVQKADFLSSPIAVERVVDGEEESYQIDWESWVGYCDYTPEQMREEKPDKPFLMRVIVKPLNYYNYDFSDDRKWRSLGLELKDSIDSFIGYVERDSEQDKKFRVMMKGGQVVACMVRVAYPTGSRSKDQVEILEIVGSGWLQNLKKDK